MLPTELDRYRNQLSHADTTIIHTLTRGCLSHGSEDTAAAKNGYVVKGRRRQDLDEVKREEALNQR